MIPAPYQPRTIEFFPDRKVLSAACWNSSFTHVTYSLPPGGLAYEDARTNKTLLIGGGSSSKRVLALPFHQWAQSVYNDYCAEEADYEVMENGEMRSAGIYNRQEFQFEQYKARSPAFQESGNPAVRFIMKITFSLCYQELFKQRGKNNPKKLDPPCYIFILPLPQCPDSTPDIETWLRGENLYYYSYNPKGGSAITVEECILLGLSPLTSNVRADYLQWDNNAYDFMEEWQKAKGFDYTTADYAKSLGIPDLLARPQEERRFEDLTDSPDVLGADLMDVDSDEVTHTTETRAPPGLSEKVEDDRMDKPFNALGGGKGGVAPTPPLPPKPPIPCNAAILSFKLPPPIPIVCRASEADIPPPPPPPAFSLSFSPSLPGEEGGVTSFGLDFHVNPPGFGHGGGGPPPPPPPDVDEPEPD
ncbi:hypothetical protein PQX77_016016 [Marasmius sp. AFHP31]|nr:hypothetical protein PQX77_016016 [Marasmius sp. AFHP31]